MNNQKLDKETLAFILRAQKNEITEHRIYTKLALKIKDDNNSDVLKQIGSDEYEHYQFWKAITGKDVNPNMWKVFFFFLVARVLGITFGIKLLERGEDAAKLNYQRVIEAIPEAKKIIDDEEKHENQLIELLEEERLQYVGSMVLGLNDALVELTGTLAGLTFALQNTRLIALAGMITGVAASFSMAASEYLSKRAESVEQGKNALKSSLYTGAAYIITVVLLITPYLVFSHFMVCLVMTIIIAVLIIFSFNFYISVAKDLPFMKRFLEMAGISLGVALLTFFIGYLIRIFLGIDV